MNCWKWKYEFFTERPNTFIPKYIDKFWESFWPDPPFPAFPSGHAIQAAATATVLGNLYGNSITITDDSHVGRKPDGLRNVEFKARTFNALWDVANEVAIGMTMPFSTIEILRQRLTPAALSRAVLLAETFTPQNGVETGFVDRVVSTEAELMPAAIEFAKSTATLNAAAHSASKQRLRSGALALIRDGLVKDNEGWKKLFLTS